MTGSCRIIVSGRCLYGHVSMASQANTPHSSYCNTAAALNMHPGCIMNLLDVTTAGQYNITNTRLIFKVFVPYGHIFTEFNSLQNVHWYETSSFRGPLLRCQCIKSRNKQHFWLIDENKPHFTKSAKISGDDGYVSSDTLFNIKGNLSALHTE